MITYTYHISQELTIEHGCVTEIHIQAKSTKKDNENDFVSGLPTAPIAKEKVEQIMLEMKREAENFLCI